MSLINHDMFDSIVSNWCNYFLPNDVEQNSTFDAFEVIIPLLVPDSGSESLEFDSVADAVEHVRAALENWQPDEPDESYIQEWDVMIFFNENTSEVDDVAARELLEIGHDGISGLVERAVNRTIIVYLEKCKSELLDSLDELRSDLADELELAAEV